MAIEEAPGRTTTAMTVEELTTAVDTVAEGMAAETDSAAADGPMAEDRTAAGTLGHGLTVAAIAVEVRTAVDIAGAGPTAEAIAVEDRMAVDIMVDRPTVEDLTVEDLTAEDTVAVRMAVATAVADNESVYCWGKMPDIESGICFCYRKTVANSPVTGRLFEVSTQDLIARR
jgi:hypothetical protein